MCLAGLPDAMEVKPYMISNMSKFLDKSDAIKARLDTLPELANVDVLVDRRKNVDSDFKKAMGKVKGAAVLIFWDGGRNINESGKLVRFRSSYVITVITKPILRGEQLPADTIIQAISKSLHGWGTDPNHCKARSMIVESVRPVAHPTFSMHAIKTHTHIDL